MNFKFFFCAFIFMVFFAIGLPGGYSARVNARKKSCVANMKTIEDAVGSYAASAEAPAERDTLEVLLRGGYLRQIPRCPDSGSGRYEIGRENGRVEVRCAVHGDLSKQDGEHRERGLGNAYMTERQVPFAVFCFGLMLIYFMTKK